MQHPEKEQIVFAPVPLMTGTALSYNSRIPTFVDNPFSCAQADGNRSMSLALAGPILGALMGHKSYVSFPNLKKADPSSSSHRHSALWPELS